MTLVTENIRDKFQTGFLAVAAGEAQRKSLPNRHHPIGTRQNRHA